MTTDRLKRIQERERRSASPAEIARARALGDLHEERCDKCDGAGFVGHRLREGEPAVPVPCACMPLDERAATVGIPMRYRSATVSNFERRAGKERALDFAAAWDGMKSVVLQGDVGRGKTHLGCGMLLRNLERFLPAKYVSVVVLMDELRARFDGGEKEQSQAYFARVAREPVLMLDDIGKEQASPWTSERIATLIDRRYQGQLPTIVTTNLTHKDLANRYGAHMADRLFEWAFIEVGGVSMRREVAV